MKEKAKNRFHGRQGGRFFAERPPGSSPRWPGDFTPVAAVCACAHLERTWVNPTDLGRPCWTCGQPLEPEPSEVPAT